MFDPSAPHIIILLVVVLLLFGSTRLPGAARALGQSMHIFKKSVKGLDEGPADSTVVTQVTAAPQPAPPPPSQPEAATQQDVQDLQRQLAELRDLQQQAAGGNATSSDATPSEAQRNQQSS